MPSDPSAVRRSRIQRALQESAALHRREVCCGVRPKLYSTSTFSQTTDWRRRLLPPATDKSQHRGLWQLQERPRIHKTNTGSSSTGCNAQDSKESFSTKAELERRASLFACTKLVGSREERERNPASAVRETPGAKSKTPMTKRKHFSLKPRCEN